ncbi:GRAM domain-containing protein [Coemansia mojavensis]|nr:GRAM domain-containing protein [Coemansia mojavensis]
MPEAPATPLGQSDSEEDSTSSQYTSDRESAVEELDADSELNAVYLRRNADFHALFRNIPINELLIDDYGCALQRDILVQGRLYLTENFVCFYSNIFGWVTSLVIAFDEIVSIEKRMTALIIPNAIQVSTLHAKHFFGSFIYRDSAYNQLYDLWVKSRSEKTAGVPETGRAEDDTGSRESLLVDSPQSNQCIEPPSLHKPTECPCGNSGHTAHYSLEALDATFPLALPLLFRVVFSASIPASLEKKYMSGVSGEELALSCTRRIEACGNTDVRTEGWVPDPDDSSREMCIYTYDKPLGFSIGPKSTTVEDTFRITMKDFDKAVIVEQVVKTPNVPSGTAFFIKVRHCLTWAAGPSNYPRGGWSRYRMTFQVEWVKTSWIKSTIEKGSMDSNKQAGEQLEKYIREWIAAHPDKEVKAGEHLLDVGEAASDAASASAVQKWRRRKHGRKRRELSPHGLRLEEVLGSDTRKRAADEIAEGGTGQQQASLDKQVVSADAKDKSSGALLVSAGSDFGKSLSRMLNLAGPTTIIIGAVVILLLAIVPAVINLWRMNGSVAMDGQYVESKRMEQLSQLQTSMDAMASQIAEINQKLQMLLERQAQP